MVGLRSSADQDAGVLFLPSVSHGGILKRERYLHHPYSFLKIPWIIRDFIYVCILRSQAQLFISLRRKEGIVPYFQVLFLLKELRRSMNLVLDENS